MRALSGLLVLAALVGCGGGDPPAGPRLYVFDCGRIFLEHVEAFGLAETETDVRELFVPCYLVEHADGRLLWDGGLPLGMAGKGEVRIQEGVTARYDRGLVEQLAELGLEPADVDRVAFSHMHFDHVGAANLFPHATLLIQRPEYEAAFEKPEQYEVFDPSHYSGLAGSRKRMLDGDHDVFGDGRVRLLSAPGHTPGHQVLLLELEELGPLVLSGDLYHFRESREGRRVPEFNTDAEDTLRSMERIEAVVAERGATLWIEHDLALAKTLDLAPAFYD